MAVYAFGVMLYLDELIGRDKNKQRRVKTFSDTTRQNMYNNRVIIQPSIFLYWILLYK